MSFEISCHLRFRVTWICLRLLQNTIEWFRALRPISGGRDGRTVISVDGLLRSTYGAKVAQFPIHTKLELRVLSLVQTRIGFGNRNNLVKKEG